MGRKAEGVALRWVGYLLDAWTVSSSCVDVVTDVMVLVAFHRGGDETRRYFQASLTIFAMAQLAYALVFAATYARRASAPRRCLVFVLVLPVSQLVPVFAWLESFHFARVDAVVAALGLEPTDALQDAAASGEDDDQLWTFVQRKYSAHAGFLAEALVEALPQAALQTIAAVRLGQTTALNLFSIALSIVVLASKGYVVAYCIDRSVCVFNALCVVADLLTVFACATWIACSPAGDVVARACVALGLATLGTLMLGAACVWLFAIFDDHLKQFRSDASLRPSLGGDSEETATCGHASAARVAFELYLVRLLAFCCCVVPAAAAFCAARLTLAPLLVFHSLDPEHATHYEFYEWLFAFVGARRETATRSARVTAANEILTACERSLPALRLRLAPRRGGADAAVRADEAARVRKWCSVLLTRGEWQRPRSFETRVAVATAVPIESAEKATHSSKEESCVAEPQSETLSRWRRTLASRRLRSAVRAWKRDLLERSDIFSYLFAQDAPHGGGARRTLVVAGVVVFCVAVLAGALFAPLALVFSVAALLLPVVQLVRLGSAHAPLAAALTLALAPLLMALLALTPRVRAFLAVRALVLVPSDLPEAAYEARAIPARIAKRYRALCERARLQAALRRKTHGVYLAAHIERDYLGPSFFDDHWDARAGGLLIKPP